MKKLELFNKYVYMIIISFILILFLRIIFKIDYQLLFIIFFLLCPLVNYFNSKLIKEKNKKALKIAIIFSLIFTFSFMPFYSAPKEDITISSINKEVKSHENNIVQIAEIKSGPYTLPLNNIKDYKKWSKANDQVTKYFNENETSKISILANQKLNITYLTMEDNASVNVIVNGKKVKQDLNNSYSRLETFEYGKVKTDYPIWKQITRVFIVFVGMIIINLYLLCVVKRVKKLFFIIPMTSYLLLAYFLQINFYTNILLIFLILFSSFLCVKFYESNYLKKYIDKTSKKVWFIILTIISTFIFIGKATFLSSATPIDITFIGIIYFIFLMFYVAIFIYASLYTIEYFSEKINKNKTNEEKKISNKKFFLIIFLILFLAWLIWGLVYYPGNLSVDSADQWIQATTGRISNNHPLISALLLRNMYLLFGNIFAMIVFQLLLFSLLIAGIFTFLYKRGFSYKFLLIFTIIFAFLPNIALINTTSWKDIPFTLAFLALTFWCYKVYVQEKTEGVKIIDLIILCILLLLASNLRYNAIFILYLVSLYFIIFGIIRKNYKIIIIFILIIIINFGLNQLMLKYYKIKIKDLSGAKYGSIIKNFIGTMYYDGDLSEEAHNQIKPLNTDEDFLTAYSSVNVDYLYYPNVGNDVKKWYPVINEYKFSGIVPLYVENIIKNPGVFLRDKLDGMMVMWSISEGSAHYIYKAYSGIDENISQKVKNIILSQSETAFTTSSIYKKVDNFLIKHYFSKIISLSQNTHFNPFLWKTGVLIMVFFITMYYAIINRKKQIWAMAIPTIAYTLSWCILLNHPSFRYVYYLYLGSLLILFLSILNIKNKKG